MKRLLVLAMLLLAVSASAVTYTLQADPSYTGRILLQNAQTTGNGNVVDMRGSYSYTTIYVSWEDGTEGGAVTIETADLPSATAWAYLVTITYNDGAPSVVHVIAPLGAVRARISATVEEGSVTVSLRAKR